MMGSCAWVHKRATLGRAPQIRHAWGNDAWAFAACWCPDELSEFRGQLRATATGGVVEAFGPQFSPDRADHLGRAAGSQPVQVATVATSVSSGFDWTDAMVGAAVTTGLCLPVC